jgi:hypothetical protein
MPTEPLDRLSPDPDPGVTPRAESSVGWGDRVVHIGFAVAAAGLVCSALGYAEDKPDWWQVEVGILVTGFGITWSILGHILRASERRN